MKLTIKNEKTLLIAKRRQKPMAKAYLSGQFTLADVGLGFGVGYDTRCSVKLGK
ncbi:MAG: hypothetical protein ACI9V8_001193 [Urechidicola sp.]|jgi:hypothetical protein